MSFLEDLFDGSHRHGHGRGDGHHDDHHDDDHGTGHDHYYGPRGGNHGAPAPAGLAAIPCPSCNVAVSFTPGARFCASCGGPLTAEPTCKGCGKTLSRGAVFCPGCGTKVS